MRFITCMLMCQNLRWFIDMNIIDAYVSIDLYKWSNYS